jgi:GntR family transcriptional regulator
VWADARTPRYRTIASVLRQAILAGDQRPGSLLPSEADLAVRFGVTRMTVRQALAGLAAEGLIERRHGHGTMVVPIRHQREPQLTLGLSDELVARGVRPGSRIIDVEELRATPEMRQLLWIGARGKVIRVRRRRYADEVLIGYQETTIASRYAPDWLHIDLNDQSLARLLRERHGLAASWTDLTIEAIAADRPKAALLDIQPGSPVLRATSLSHLADGRPLELTIGWFPGTRYSYKLPHLQASTVRAADGEPAIPSEASANLVGAGHP